MANNPKKVKDPTEVALSAIQEALNISDTGIDTPRSAPRDEVAPPIPPAPPSYDEPALRGAAPAARRAAAHGDAAYEPLPEPRATSRRAANDDRETIGQLLQAI